MIWHTSFILFLKNCLKNSTYDYNLADAATKHAECMCSKNDKFRTNPSDWIYPAQDEIWAYVNYGRAGEFPALRRKAEQWVTKNKIQARILRKYDTIGIGIALS